MTKEFKYEVGQMVCWVNKQGVCLGWRKIIDREINSRGPCYFINPHDAHWCPVHEDDLFESRPKVGQVYKVFLQEDVEIPLMIHEYGFPIGTSIITQVNPDMFKVSTIESSLGVEVSFIDKSTLDAGIREGTIISVSIFDLIGKIVGESVKDSVRG